MTTTATPQGMIFTDEQLAFAEAIQDFCRRELGTREQRDALTDGGKEAHNQQLYERIAELGWAGVAIPEEYGGAGGSPVDQRIFPVRATRRLAPINGAGS